MISSVPPGLILILGALIAPWLQGRIRLVWLLMLPLLSAGQLLFFLPVGTVVSEQFFGYALQPVHVDKLSLVWGYVFHLAAFLSVVYALHVDDGVETAAALIYAGAAIGAVFAGDLMTLFVYWELTAVASVFLVWASRTERSYRAGMRYLIVQVGSGVLLLSGILLHLRNTGSLAFVAPFYESLPDQPGLFRGLNSLDTLLIFVAFGIKAAFPLLHNWVQDAYPEATPTGTVFLSAFTTKLAVYALARGFAGTECLIWIGAVMVVFPLPYALIENDLRRVLAYSLNNQLGFMVVGVGLANLATHPEAAQLALNGTAAHAFAHVLYKGLLFMTIGAVLMRTGTAKCSELGGLVRTMPLTAGFCVVGTASIAACPLFSGFATKSMIMSAAAEEHHTTLHLILLFAAAAAVLPDLKVPMFAFWGRDSGRRPEEAPVHMLVAMGIAAALCVLIGVAPGALYSVLPYEAEYRPYTLTHVISQAQLVAWAVLAFFLIRRFGLYPRERPSVNLDTDWFYRRPFLVAVNQTTSPAGRVVAWAIRGRGLIATAMRSVIDYFLRRARVAFGVDGAISQPSSLSATVLWAAILLTAYLVLYYVFV